MSYFNQPYKAGKFVSITNMDNSDSNFPIPKLYNDSQSRLHEHGSGKKSIFNGPLNTKPYETDIKSMLKQVVSMPVLKT